MAKLKFKPLVYDIRGKMGGAIFKRHPYSDQTVLEPTRKNRRALPPTPLQKIQQERLAAADTFYKQMPQSERDTWKAAVKKNHLTGYQLFMKECLGLFSQGRNGPVVPSISGGYTYDKATPHHSRENPHGSFLHCGGLLKHVFCRFVRTEGIAERYLVQATLTGVDDKTQQEGCDIQICFPMTDQIHGCDPFGFPSVRAHYHILERKWVSMPDVGPGPIFIWIFYVQFWEFPAGCFDSHSPCYGHNAGGFKEGNDWWFDDHVYCPPY